MIGRRAVGRVSRMGKWLQPEELRALAGHLATIERARADILRILNGRVLVTWLDPLMSGGKACKFFGDLRSALDDEWCASMGDDTHPSPFYGETWKAATAARLASTGATGGGVGA